MAKTRGKTKAARDEAFKATEAVGRAVRAFADAATEASLSSIRLVSDTTINVAERVASAFTDALVEPANIAQRSIDRFFSTLSGNKEEDDKEDGDENEDADAAAMLSRAAIRPGGVRPERGKGDKPADDAK